MYIAFDTIELRSACEDENAARARLCEGADEFLAAFADVASADFVADLPPNVLALDGDMKTFRMKFGVGEAVFALNHAKPPHDANGGLDLTRVNRLRVVGIETND